MTNTNEKNTCSNTYAKLSLRKQLFLETRAMAEHALAKGSQVPPEVIKTLEASTTNTNITGHEENLDDLFNSGLKVNELVEAHNTMVRIVAPAIPRTLLLLDMEQKTSGFWKFLGPISLIRQLIISSIVCLTLFVLISLSPDVNKNAASILNGQGLPLLLNLLFYLAAAGLGASFAGLYKANYYITEGTFDATHHASYWIRFLLGLIAGLLIAVLISDHAFDDKAEVKTLLEPGVVRPLLAMLGGFSANLVYTILSRLVETLQSLFKGSSQAMLTAKVKEAGATYAAEKLQQDVKVVSGILSTQQLINGETDPAEIKTELNRLIKELLPSISIPGHQ